MTRYAENTSVSVERSRLEIEAVLKRYGADRFAYFTGPDDAAIAFQAHGRSIKFRVKIPKADEFVRTEKNKTRTLVQREAFREAAERQRWRCLLLVVKAKLEAVESGVATFETEFLPYTVLPDGRTVAEHVEPQLLLALESGSLPRLSLGMESQ